MDIYGLIIVTGTGNKGLGIGQQHSFESLLNIRRFRFRDLVCPSYAPMRATAT